MGALFSSTTSSAFAGGAFGLGEVNRRVGKLLQHRVGTLALDLPVILVNRLLDVLFRREGNIDSTVQYEPQLSRWFPYREGRS